MLQSPDFSRTKESLLGGILFYILLASEGYAIRNKAQDSKLG